MKERMEGQRERDRQRGRKKSNEEREREKKRRLLQHCPLFEIILLLRII
jgi:hypothetical protein